MEYRQLFEIKENETQTLNCAIKNDDVGSSDGKPGNDYSTTFEWTKNGLQIRPSNNIQVTISRNYF